MAVAIEDHGQGYSMKQAASDMTFPTPRSEIGAIAFANHESEVLTLFSLTRKRLN